MTLVNEPAQCHVYAAYLKHSEQLSSNAGWNRSKTMSGSDRVRNMPTHQERMMQLSKMSRCTKRVAPFMYRLILTTQGKVTSQITSSL